MLNTQENPNTDHHPRAGYYPDHERVIKLERMADGITELVAHLDAGTFQLLKLICEFDQNEGGSGPGIRSSATAPALLYLLHPCSRVRTG
jgi:hypothetical protein